MIVFTAPTGKSLEIIVLETPAGKSIAHMPRAHQPFEQAPLALDDDIAMRRIVEEIIGLEWIVFELIELPVIAAKIPRLIVHITPRPPAQRLAVPMLGDRHLLYRWHARHSLHDPNAPGFCDG